MSANQDPWVMKDEAEAAASLDDWPARDPSLRDVLARLDEIERKLDVLLSSRDRGR